MESTMPSITDSFKLLEGKTIKSVKVLGVNCVLIEMENGELFTVEIVEESLGIFGMKVLRAW